MKDFDKIVSSAHLAANGWSLDGYNHSNPFKGHVFYVVDFRFSSVNLFSVDAKDFESISCPSEVGTNELAGCVAELMKYVQNKSIDTLKNQNIVPSLVSYIKKTRTFTHWMETTSKGSRLHAVLNIYKSGSGEALVRPMIIRSDSTYIEVSELMEFSLHVMDQDKAAHPEWF